MSSIKLFDLSGGVAVVSGGIGRSIALGLAQAGSAVALLERTGAPVSLLSHFQF
jgi:NAD(P)-dependent dehydrogenase (short-subunit alcohol dehydrogenase family)